MAFCTATQIRQLTNLSTADISDADLTSIISYATYQINHDISTEVVRERIDYLDDTRQNKRDGSNTTYYVKNWKGKYIADRDDDGDVDTADISVVVVDTSTSPSTETTATVSSIDPELGRFVLSTAPDNADQVYVTYKWSYADTETPAPLVKMACILLSAAYAHGKINWGTAPSVQFGNTKIMRHMEAFDKFYKQYQRIVTQINNKMLSVSDAGGI